MAVNWNTPKPDERADEYAARIEARAERSVRFNETSNRLLALAALVLPIAALIIWIALGDAHKHWSAIPTLGYVETWTYITALYVAVALARSAWGRAK